MSLKSAESLFFKDYAVKTLELKGDYEIWSRDIEEYFNVSGLPTFFAAIVEYSEADPKADLRPDEKDCNLDIRHALIMKQARYAIYRSLGDTIKREIAKEKLDTTNVCDLWRAIRSCFYLEDEATIQQLRDDIGQLDIEKAGSWANFCDQLERLYTRLDVVAGERSFTSSDKLYEQCWKFADKRLKIIDKPQPAITAKRVATL